MHTYNKQRGLISDKSDVSSAGEEEKSFNSVASQLYSGGNKMFLVCFPTSIFRYLHLIVPDKVFNFQLLKCTKAFIGSG